MNNQDQSSSGLLEDLRHGKDLGTYHLRAAAGKSEATFAASDGSAENVALPNDTKIRFCNAVDGMKAHCILCKECDIYMRWGDGDLCSAGKTIIAMELCYADTSVEFPPNDPSSATRPTKRHE